MINLDSIDDPDELTWMNWLLDLTKPMKALPDNGDDPNDKDFNYMEEVLEEDTEVRFPYKVKWISPHEYLEADLLD